MIQKFFATLILTCFFCSLAKADELWLKNISTAKLNELYQQIGYTGITEKTEATCRETPYSDFREITQNDQYIYLAKHVAESMIIPLTGSDRKEIAEDLLRYLEFHTESTIAVRSLDVLHDVFL